MYLITGRGPTAAPPEKGEATTWLDSEPVANRNNYPLLYNDAHMPKLAVEAIKNF